MKTTRVWAVEGRAVQDGTGYGYALTAPEETELDEVKQRMRDMVEHSLREHGVTAPIDFTEGWIEIPDDEA